MGVLVRYVNTIGLIDKISLISYSHLLILSSVWSNLDFLSSGEQESCPDEVELQFLFHFLFFILCEFTEFE